MRTFQTFLVVFLLASLPLLGEEPPLHKWPQFPGLTPDCWPDVRMVHDAECDYGSWERYTKIATVALPAGQAPGGAYGAAPVPVPEGAVLSENAGYWFAVEHNEASQHSVLRVFAEKRHFYEIAFEVYRDAPEVRWINEKLLFIRAQWGRVLSTDVILDVETEKLLYVQEVTFAVVAWQQFHGDCPIMDGCPCIKKRSEP